VVADQADRDVGLLGDLGDPELRLTVRLEVADGGTQKPLTAVRAFSCRPGPSIT